MSLLNKLKERVDLAKQLEIAQHRASKAAHEEKWLAKAAEDMEIDLGGDEYVLSDAYSINLG